MFVPYMHVERFGNEEVDGIELGKVFVFPKIDGTNASVWGHTEMKPYDDCDETGPAYFYHSGSRTRELSFESDNAGFHLWLNGNTQQSARCRSLTARNPNLRFYGEWLVPHSFKGYREDAWRKFYIFDVFNDETQQYLSYDAYQPLLAEFVLDYIPPLAIVNNGDYERFIKYLNDNHFLCPDGGEVGEGIVLKNYDYYNKFGRQTWAKIIRQEFKELHNRTMGAPEINTGLMNEERILNRALTTALIDKTIEKIINSEGPVLDRVGWSSKRIPELFQRVFYDIVREELWDSLKEIEFGSVNFKTLKALMIMRIKQMKKELF